MAGAARWVQKRMSLALHLLSQALACCLVLPSWDGCQAKYGTGARLWTLLCFVMLLQLWHAHGAAT